MFTYILIPFIIPIISFVLQSYPRIFNKSFGVDVWTRLLETDHIRKNHHRIPKNKLTGQFIIDGYFDYPPVFPTILSYLPKKTLLNLQGFIAPFIDSLQVLLVFHTAFFLTHNFWLAITAQVMYTLTPMIAIENSYLTPRSLGYLIFSLATLPSIIFFHNGQFYWYVIGVFFTTILFLTHRFAIQSFLFLAMFFTFFFNTAIFIQSFLLGFVFAVVLTKGYYLRVLKGHLYNIYFWIKNLDYRFSHQVRGSVKKETKTDFVNRLYKFLSVFSPIALFGLNPWSISGFIIIGFFVLKFFPVEPILFMFGIWILFFYFLGVVVLKTKYLMPIGEGQRYMEMATVPSAILASWIFHSFLPTPVRSLAIISFILLCVINLVLIVFIQVKGVIKDRNRSVTSDMKKVFNYINKQKTPLRIICIPHQNTTMTIYHTKAQVLVNADNPGLMKIQEIYPILGLSLKEIAKKYNITHILLKESFATLKELHLTQKQVVYGSGDVKIVKI